MSSVGGLQHVARHDEKLLADLARRQHRSAAGNDQRAAREGAPAIGRAVGVAMHDAHVLRRHADFVGDDLGERRAQPLPVRARADAGFDAARRVHGDLDGFPSRRDLHAARREGGAAVAGAFGKCREADAEIHAAFARLLLARAEGRRGPRKRRLSPGSRDSCPRRAPIRSRTCRESGRSGCVCGFRPGLKSNAAAALSISRSMASVMTGRETPR